MSDPEGPEPGAPTQEPPRKLNVNRWVSRGSLLFLLVVLLLVLVFGLLRPGWFEDEGGSEPDPPPPELSFDKSLTDLGESDGITLSDDTSTSQTFTFSVPVDVRLDDAQLRLHGRTQVPSSSTIFLRVLANGESAFVAELPEGDHDLDAEIPLPPGVTDDGSVRVQVRTTGTLDQRTCNIDQELGALVSLDPDATRVEGRLDEELATVRDVAAGLVHQVTLELAFPAGSQPWFETAAAIATALTQAGFDVSFHDAADELSEPSGSRVLIGPADALAGLGWSGSGDAGSIRVGDIDDVAVLGVVEPDAEVAGTFFTTSPLTTADSAATEPRTATPERPAGRTVTLQSLGVDTSVQKLTDSRSWFATYSLADLPGGPVPTEVALDFQLPLATDDARWLVQVRLNGQLVDSVRLAGDLTAQSVRARIPEGLETLRNQLTVTLLRDRDLGGCNVRQTSYDVQLLPTSSLVLDGTGLGFTAVPALLAGGFEVQLASSSADDPAGTLPGLVPTLAEFAGWQQQPTFAWDGTPGAAPFLYYGEPPEGLDVPVQVEDGRVVSDQLNLQAFADGVVVQFAQSGGGGGLVVTPVGAPGDAVPDYGRESARLVTADGGGFVVNAAGQAVTAPPVRAVGRR